MPVYELACHACRAVEDVYLSHWDDPTPDCPICLGARERLISRFASPYMGSLRKYSDLNRENAQMEGFWAYRTRSSISGNPEPVYLDSMQAVVEFNKAEGLAAPGEVPTHSTISPDGRRILSDGMPGNWRGGALPEMPARMREMVEIPAERCQPPAATSAPSMPMDYGIRVEAVETPAEVGG